MQEDPVPGIGNVVQFSLEDFREEHVQVIGIPPTVHIRFAETKRTVGDGPIEEALVVDLDVARRITAYGYVDPRKHIGHDDDQWGQVPQQGSVI